MPHGNDNNKMIELRDRLKELGYTTVRIVNIDCLEIDQNITHYLSHGEGMALSTTNLQHPVNLSDYAERRGRNFWYSFPSGQTVSQVDNK